MLIDCKIPQYNIRLLNFDYILKHTFQRYNNDASKYGVSNCFKQKDTQKLFINALIVTLCDKIKSMNGYESVAIYINRNTYMIPHTESDIILPIILKTLKKLPFQFIISDNTVDFFLDAIHNNVVEFVILLESQLNYSNNFDVLKFSFKGLIKFLKTYDLIYLYNVYFKQLGNKLLVVR
jgi:hypothetical protein